MGKFCYPVKGYPTNGISIIFDRKCFSSKLTTIVVGYPLLSGNLPEI